MALSPQWLDELRARITLSTVIGRHVRLQKAGREFKACCPFHDEKTPSFTINDVKGFYHCFGCGAHGDAIRWMTDQRGLAFMDAVKELAVDAGMEVPAPDPQFARRAEERAGLQDVTAAAQDWFVANLGSSEGTLARAYLAKRGFSLATMRQFGFGYAPKDRQALGRALARFEEPLLVEAGMRISIEKRDPYDRFRDRLMLPIQDARGRVIAFGGRILDGESNTKAPKYLNSPDTKLFDKGRTLYNLHRAAPAARQSGRMIVVEGYMDVIALAEAGIREAVAPMGTALTEQQLELLWRHVERPVLCFDGDAAGRRAAMRAIERALPLLRPAHSLAIVQMPTGLDPDDLLRQEGRQALENLLAGASGLLDMLWQVEREATPLTSPEDKAGLKQRLLDHTEAIAHPDIRALYRRELTERFSAFAFPKREWTPRGSWKKGGAPRPAPTLTPEAAARLRHVISGGGRDSLAVAVIAGLARFPDQIVRHEEGLSDLAMRDQNIGPAIDLLLETAETLDSSGGSPISRIQGLPAPPETSRFAFLDEGTDPVDAREELAEAVSLLVERPALEAALVEATARFESDPEGAFAEQQRLLRRKLEFEARLGQMASNRASRARQESDSRSADIADPAHKTD